MKGNLIIFDIFFRLINFYGIFFNFSTFFNYFVIIIYVVLTVLFVFSGCLFEFIFALLFTFKIQKIHSTRHKRLSQNSFKIFLLIIMKGNLIIFDIFFRLIIFYGIFFNFSTFFNYFVIIFYVVLTVIFVFSG